MRSADFFQHADDSQPKCDRLFRAAITGYCSITRPGSRDAAQLDDLALPMLPLVSEDSKRFAAAALSETMPAPPGLLRRLADHPVAISAPLLLRSRALADIDLIGLIGRNGLAHARVIARRPGLNPNIAALARALGVAPETETAAVETKASDNLPVEAAASRPTRSVADAAEETRVRLRGMMRPAVDAALETIAAAPHRQPPQIDWVAAHAAYPRLVATGLTGRAALFQTAVADAFELSFSRACEIVEDGEALAVALKAAGLTVAEAFFVTALAFPPRFADTAAIRSFVEQYRRLDVGVARKLVSSWQAAAPRAVPVQEVLQPANSDERSGLEASAPLLKAS